MDKHGQFENFLQSLKIGDSSVKGIMEAVTALYEAVSPDERERISKRARQLAKNVVYSYQKKDEEIGKDFLRELRYVANMYKKDNKSSSADDALDILLGTFEDSVNEFADDKLAAQIEKDFTNLGKPTEVDFKEKKKRSKAHIADSKTRGVKPTWTFKEKYAQGNKLTGEKKYNLAASAYGNAAAASTNKRELIMGLAVQAQSLINAGSDREALAVLRELLKHSPKNRWALSKASRIEKNLKSETSEEYFKRTGRRKKAKSPTPSKKVDTSTDKTPSDTEKRWKEYTKKKQTERRGEIAKTKDPIKPNMITKYGKSATARGWGAAEAQLKRKLPSSKFTADDAHWYIAIYGPEQVLAQHKKEVISDVYGEGNDTIRYNLALAKSLIDKYGDKFK